MRQTSTHNTETRHATLMKRMAIRLTMLVLMAMPMTVGAQTLKLVSAELTNQFIAVDDRVTDWNDELCALVKVQGIVADSVSGDFQQKRMGNERWAYLTAGSKRLTIYKEGYVPLQVVFADHGIASIESNRVYQLVVVAEGPGPSPTDGIVIFSVTPKNAVISVDGQQLDVDADGIANAFLTYGSHTYTASAPGYERQEQAFNISSDRREISVTLQSVTAQVTISCATPEAQIFINGQPRGKGSWTGTLSPQRYRVEARLANHELQQMNIDVKKNENQHFTIPPLKPFMGRLFVDFRPNGSKVVVDRKHTFTTPCHIDSLTYGTHSISITKEGYEPHTQQVTVSNKETATIRGKLKSLPMPIPDSEPKPKPATPVHSDYAVVAFGLRAGLNISSPSFEQNTGDHYGGGTGFHLGPTLTYRLHDLFALKAAALFSTKAFSNDNHLDDYDMHASSSWIDIPIEAALIPVSSDAFELQIGAGPYVAIGLGGSVKDERYHDFDDPFFKRYSRFDFGLNVSATAVIASHFTVGAAFQLGLGNSYKNRCIGISLGYQF